MSYDVREYFKDPFTRDEMERMLDRARLEPSDLVATHSTPYRTQRLGEQQLAEVILMERMLAEPRLVRRPILVTDREVTVGFNQERYEAIAQKLAEDQTRSDSPQMGRT